MTEYCAGQFQAPLAWSMAGGLALKLAGFAWEKLGKWWLKWQKTSKTMDFPAGKECWSNVGLTLDDLRSINMVFQHSP